jgi:hypothetical protein
MLRNLFYAVLLSCFFSAYSFAQNGNGYDLKLLQPAGANGFTFEDESIKISFPLSTHLSFTLTNKTKAALQIDWKNASFTDVNGQPQKIIHEDVRNAAKVDAQPISEVIANGSLTDTIVPVGFITHQADSDSWLLRKLFQGGIENYVGKQFTLRLPLKVGGQEKEYLFTFTVESAK